jgi:SAM-dependent methyltransferase
VATSELLLRVKPTTDPKAHSESLRQEFNRWAEAGRGEGMEQEHLPIVLPVLDRMHLDPDDNVLDVGCGAGWLARLLAEQIPEGRVVGVDLSDEMIRRARRNNADLENAMFVVGEAEEIPWDANFFTRAISVEAGYYWQEPQAALREIHRVLRERGTAWLLVNYYRENVHSHQWRDLLTIPVHLLSAQEWAGLFREAGFTDVGHEYIPDPTPAPEKYEGRWFRDAAQLRDFRRQGALLVWGRKT